MKTENIEICQYPWAWICRKCMYISNESNRLHARNVIPSHGNLHPHMQHCTRWTWMYVSDSGLHVDSAEIKIEIFEFHSTTNNSLRTLSFTLFYSDAIEKVRALRAHWLVAVVHRYSAKCEKSKKKNRLSCQTRQQQQQRYLFTHYTRARVDAKFTHEFSWVKSEEKLFPDSRSIARDSSFFKRLLLVIAYHLAAVVHKVPTTHINVYDCGTWQPIHAHAWSIHTCTNVRTWKCLGFVAARSRESVHFASQIAEVKRSHPSYTHIFCFFHFPSLFILCIRQKFTRPFRFGFSLCGVCESGCVQHK